MMRFGLLAALLCFPLAAHIGNQDVFFEGLAGPYPVYVSIRPPLVIPGVAEISIRAGAKDIQQIRLTPMPLTGPGSKFPPTPDVAQRSSQDAQLFTGGLWIMFPNAWQVQLIVDGARGPAGLSVPVPAVSSKVTQMDSQLGLPLAALMLLLLLGVAGIAGAALRESQLTPGELPTAPQKRRGAMAMGVGLVLGLGVIYFGQQWWSAEAADYARSIYKPLGMQASLSGDQLTLQLQHSGWRQSKDLNDFIPDHGHLMHLYAVRSPKLDQVFHLHPSFDGKGRFTMALPAMPAGDYKLFGDVVHKNGFPETLTANLVVPERPAAPALSGDDAGAALPEVFSPTTERVLADGSKVLFEVPADAASGKGLSLRFRVLDKEGNPAADLRPYLGMSAHLGVFRKDFGVFSHVHPAGNISMAAFDLAQQNLIALAAPALPDAHGSQAANAPVAPDFSFPYGFPSAGEYRLVLQFRRLALTETVSFDIDLKK
jgi:hypothetical protein